MQRKNDFTTGKILSPLLRFMLPVFSPCFCNPCMGLATPCATVLQVVMCLVCFRLANHKYHSKDERMG